MTSKLNLLLALLLYAPFVLAQQKSPPMSTSSQGVPPGQEMLAGCLQQSGMEYTLTDKEGLLHHLTGGKNMKQYAGHEVELYGKNGIRTIDNTSYGVASSAKEQAVFQIKGVKDLGPPCQSPGR